MLSLANGEEIGVSRDRFGGAKNEEAARLEREMERTHDPALQGRRHIDQNVPTTHEVELRERRVLREIVPRENAHLPQGLVDLIAAVNFREESPQSRGGYGRLDVLHVETAPCARDDGLAHISGKDLDRRVGGPITTAFKQRDRDRIHFLASRAARYPNSERIVGSATFLEERREHRLRKDIEDVGIAEESGDVNQQVSLQSFDFSRMRLKMLRIILEGLDPRERHAP